MRDMLVGSSSKIMFEELPNVDAILQLLNDILLVRSFVLLELEDELYEKLVYIYRDPIYMIQITRHHPRHQTITSTTTTFTTTNTEPIYDNHQKTD